MSAGHLAVLASRSIVLYIMTRICYYGNTARWSFGTCASVTEVWRIPPRDSGSHFLCDFHSTDVDMAYQITMGPAWGSSRGRYISHPMKWFIHVPDCSFRYFCRSIVSPTLTRKHFDTFDVYMERLESQTTMIYNMKSSS